MSKTEERKMRKQLEAARSALRVIRTWATYREGEILDRHHVADLCKRTLAKMEEPKKEQS